MERSALPSPPPLYVSDHFGVLVDAAVVDHHASIQQHHLIKGTLTLRPGRGAPALEDGG